MTLCEECSAPHLKKGGKAHGPKPKDYYFPTNEKMRLFALKSMLSAKLYEEKLILVDSEQLEYAKTKVLNEIVKPFKDDRILMVTGFEPC